MRQFRTITRFARLLHLAPFYPKMGRPSIDPELMIRMLIIGYVFAIRSEQAICRDVQVNLAYRWFCGLSIEDKIPRSLGVFTCPS
jgi:transposase